MAVDPVTAAKVANSILKVCSVISGEKESKLLKNIGIIVLAVVVAIVLLVGAIIDIILSPLEPSDEMFEFREKYKDEILLDFKSSGTEWMPINNINPGSNNADLRTLVDSLPEMGTDRRKIIEAALPLVGNVGYFWGGKSSAGWNDEWGKSKLVTAPGSKTSGTYQPFGLDCSGFTDWVYRTAGMGNVLTGLQWYDSYEISESELKPGDLVFLYPPGTGKVNHVGIYYGRNKHGKKMYIHCASGSGVVVNSYSGFKYWRRVLLDWGDES